MRSVITVRSNDDLAEAAAGLPGIRSAASESHGSLTGVYRRGLRIEYGNGVPRKIAETREPKNGTDKRVSAVSVAD